MYCPAWLPSNYYLISIKWRFLLAGIAIRKYSALVAKEHSLTSSIFRDTREKYRSIRSRFDVRVVNAEVNIPVQPDIRVKKVGLQVSPYVSLLVSGFINTQGLRLKGRPKP